MQPARRRVLIVGGGYVGMYAALEMQRELSRAGHELTLVNPENYMQYQPFLPEVASGNIEPRHVVVPLRQILKKTSVLVGEVRRIDHDRRVATVRTPNGENLDVPYDVLVLGAGSRSRVLPVPGLAEQGSGSRPWPRPSSFATTCCPGSTPPPRSPTRIIGGPPSPSSSWGPGTRGWKPWRSWRTWPARRCTTTRACIPTTCSGSW